MVSGATFKRLDGIQLRFGRSLLRVPPNTANEYVLRELRLEHMEHRALVASFKFFGHLCRLPEKERLAAFIFRRRCEQVDRGAAALSWCHKLEFELRRAGMEQAWSDRTVPADWNSQVKLRCRRTFLQSSNQEIKGKSSLNLFRRLKPAAPHGILSKPLNHLGAAIRIKLRCGGAPLMAAVGAALEIPADQRTCRMCNCNVVENAIHFVSRCAFYDDLRRHCQQRLRDLIGSELDPDLQRAVEDFDVDIVLGDKFAAKLSDEKRRKWDSIIINFLRLAWRKRDTVWKTLTLPDNAWRLAE
jgi:hypothetical protein